MNVAESGCGGAPVTIKNQATASLYNYTPYQPNAASLAAYPGTGDACSAYGNRNFFFLFRKYFGSTGAARRRPWSTPRCGPPARRCRCRTARTCPRRWPADDHRADAAGRGRAGGRVSAPWACPTCGAAAGPGRARTTAAPGRGRLQQLRPGDRLRLLRPDRVRAGHGRYATPATRGRSAGPGSRSAGRTRCPATSWDSPGMSRSTWAPSGPALHPRGVLGRDAGPHRAADPDRHGRSGAPVLDRQPGADSGHRRLRGAGADQQLRHPELLVGVGAVAEQPGVRWASSSGSSGSTYTPNIPRSGRSRSPPPPRSSPSPTRHRPALIRRPRVVTVTPPAPTPSAPTTAPTTTPATTTAPTAPTSRPDSAHLVGTDSAHLFGIDGAHLDVADQGPNHAVAGADHDSPDHDGADHGAGPRRADHGAEQPADHRVDRDGDSVGRPDHRHHSGLVDRRHDRPHDRCLRHHRVHRERVAPGGADRSGDGADRPTSPTPTPTPTPTYSTPPSRRPRPRPRRHRPRRPRPPGPPDDDRLHRRPRRLGVRHRRDVGPGRVRRVAGPAGTRRTRPWRRPAEHRPARPALRDRWGTAAPDPDPR